MMRSFHIAFSGMKILLVFIITCAPALVIAAAPSWYFDYVKNNPGCEREYLCVVGEGETVADALGEARLDTAKFFQTKIKAKSQLSSSAEQLGISAQSAKFEEWTNKTITEEANEIISGLELKRQEEINGHIYVLMTLNRANAAKNFKDKIESLDLENAKKFSLNSRFSYPNELKNLLLIDAYLDRYNLLEQTPLKIKVKKEDIQEKINNLKPLQMGLVTVGKKLPAQIQHMLIDLLSPLKIVIVSKKHSPKYTLRSELITEEQYFKVDGFKKLNVILKLELIDDKANIFGKLSAINEQVARTNAQAIEKAIPFIKESIEENLDQLSTIKMED